MITEFPRRLGIRLFTTMVLSIVGTGLALFLVLPPSIFLFLGLFLAIYLGIPTFGGLICKDSMVAVYIVTSMVFATFLSGRAFLLRAVLVMNEVMSVSLFSLFFSVAFSFIDYHSCNIIREWEFQKRTITRRRILLSFSIFALSITSIAMYANLESIHSFIQQNTWVVTILVGAMGVVTNLLIFFWGRRSHAKEK